MAPSILTGSEINSQTGVTLQILFFLSYKWSDLRSAVPPLNDQSEKAAVSTVITLTGLYIVFSAVFLPKIAFKLDKK